MDVRTRSPNNQVPNALVGDAALLPDVDDTNPTITLAEEGSEEGNQLLPSEEGSPHAADEATVAEEAEARQGGWVDREEWVSRHGSEKGWKPAADYNDFKRNFLPLLRRENQELRSKLDALSRTVNTDQSERQAAKDRLAKETLRAELRQAREDQDWDKVDEITERMMGLQVAAAVPKAQPTQQFDPEVVAMSEQFARDNPWLKDDQDLAVDFALNLKGVVDARIPGMSMEQCMNKARQRTINMNPDKFRSARNRPALADSGGQGSIPRGSGRERSWNDLKPEVKSEMEEFLRDNPGLTRAGILKNCDASHFRS